MFYYFSLLYLYCISQASSQNSSYGLNHTAEPLRLPEWHLIGFGTIEVMVKCPTVSWCVVCNTVISTVWFQSPFHPIHCTRIQKNRSSSHVPMLVLKRTGKHLREHLVAVLWSPCFRISIAYHVWQQCEYRTLKRNGVTHPVCNRPLSASVTHHLTCGRLLSLVSSDYYQ